MKYIKEKHVLIRYYFIITFFVKLNENEKNPYKKNCFINQYQNNTRTSKKYTRTSIKHTGSGIILALVYETFPKG